MDALHQLIKYRLKLSLAELIKEFQNCPARPGGYLINQQVNGFGLLVTPEKETVLGEQDTQVMVGSQGSQIALDAKDSSIHGQLCLFPDDDHRVMTINGGQINAKLFPGKGNAAKAEQQVWVRKPDEKPPYVWLPAHKHNVDPMTMTTIDTIYEQDERKLELEGWRSEDLFGENFCSDDMLKKSVDAWSEEMERALAEIDE